MRFLFRSVLIALTVLFPVSGFTAPPLSNGNLPLTSTNLSGTIAVTNTFQSLQGPTNNRQGCTIVPLGTHAMNVYFGSCANATLSNSTQLSQGQPLFCSVSGASVLIDQVCITGIAGDAFYANFQ